MRSPTGWVHRVALNELRRRLRRRRAEPGLAVRARRTLVSSGEAEPPSTVDPELWRVVAGLPRRQREAIALRYIADLRERDVAVAMGVSEGAASATLAAARRALADRLGEGHLREETAR
jgi:RNA polymerase sigma factor (sigma-70 family)